MTDETDLQLLRDYAEHRSEAAFAELVRRHLDFVYSAARRMVCDAHLAEDVSQAVFVALAKNAAQLTGRPVLSGWLHRTAQNIAAQTVRTDVRRRAREQEAVAMNDLLSPGTVTPWEDIAPHLDEALNELSEPDRDALLLRYFERKSARDMAQILTTTDEAAQKRVSRAVERLRDLFAQRGITVGTGGLAVIISANAVQAAPPGLAATMSGIAITATNSTTSSALISAKTIAMTTLQKTLIVTVIAATTLAGGKAYLVHEYNARFRTVTAKSDFVLNWGQTAMSGKWATPSGGNVYIFTTPKTTTNASRLSLEIKMVKAASQKSSLAPKGIGTLAASNFNGILTSDQLDAAVGALGKSGIVLESTLESVESGKEAVMRCEIDDAEKINASIVFLPKISADGDSVALQVAPTLSYRPLRSK